MSYTVLTAKQKAKIETSFNKMLALMTGIAEMFAEAPGAVEKPQKKRRGRPRKEATEEVAAAPKKRGRPPKAVAAAESAEAEAEAEDGDDI